MPYSFQVPPDSPFLLAVGTGAGSMEEYFEAIRTASAELRPRPELAVPCDLTAYHHVPTPHEVWRLATHLGMHLEVLNRGIALVVRPGLEYRMSQMLALIAGGRGTPVSAFLQRADAETWLRARLAA